MIEITPDLDMVMKCIENGLMTSPVIARKLKLSKPTISGRTRELEVAGLITRKQTSSNKPIVCTPTDLEYIIVEPKKQKRRGCKGEKMKSVIEQCNAPWMLAIAGIQTRNAK